MEPYGILLVMQICASSAFRTCYAVSVSEAKKIILGVQIFCLLANFLDLVAFEFFITVIRERQ